MEEKYTRFFLALQHRLAQPLPGLAAHQKMASSISSSASFRAVTDGKSRQSAVLLLLYPYQGTLHLPLILRPAYDGVHGGQVALPGGGQEKFDRDLIQTALREAQEEIGIKASDIRVLGQLSPLYISASNYVVQPVVGCLPYRPDFFPDAREVAEIIELSLSLLADKGIVGTKELLIRNVLIQAPFYGVHSHIVWGATAMMLSEFLTTLDEIGEADKNILDSKTKKS
ncbi:MAG: CoA pyrophosphatase [Bacteroidota bacterium]